MAGSKINSYGIGDTNATSIMQTLDAQRIGYHALTLTEFDTDTKPSIAAGSKVEINGALFKFDSEETISGTPSDGDVYVLLTTSGDSVTASFTNTAPTWSDSKQGWYGTGGSENYRYANFIMTKSGSDYSDKRYYQPSPMNKFNSFSVDTFDFDSFLTQDLSSDGYIKLGSIYVQWGLQSSGASPMTVTFPLEFPNACLSVVHSNSTTTNSGDNASCYIDTTSTTTTTFRMVGINGNLGQAFYWIAIGY